MKKLTYLLLAMAICASLDACDDAESGGFDVDTEDTASGTAGGLTDELLNDLKALSERVPGPYGDVG